MRGGASVMARLGCSAWEGAVLVEEGEGSHGMFPISALKKSRKELKTGGPLEEVPSVICLECLNQFRVSRVFRVIFAAIVPLFFGK